MKRYTHLPLLLALCAFTLALMPAQAHADSLGDLKERMKERVKTVDKLKESGAVGVTNQGYLEARKELDEDDAKLIEAENKDRLTVYTYIAKKADVPVSKVEKQRAAELAKLSAKGVWLQDAKGKWYRKE